MHFFKNLTGYTSLILLLFWKFLRDKLLNLNLLIFLINNFGKFFCNFCHIESTHSNNLCISKNTLWSIIRPFSQFYACQKSPFIKLVPFKNSIYWNLHKKIFDKIFKITFSWISRIINIEACGWRLKSPRLIWAPRQGTLAI